MDPSRRDAVAGLAAIGLLPRGAMAQGVPSGPATPFSWDALQQRAAALAKRPFVPAPAVPAAAAIGYDAAGAIRYRAERTLAGGIRLFPLGVTAPTPVAIHIVENGRARVVPFAADLFTGGGGPAALGIAGFRAMTADGRSDWMAFQGASYFRAAGAQDQYGLSARAVAIDTGTGEREAFPAFTAFWIERTGAQAYTVHALLEGASVTGAYRFVSRLDGGVVQDVSAVLHIRRPIARIGIAPMTSMYWYGAGDRQAGSDWRPEIHDSDGLALWTGAGERIWRPLVNPARATLDGFADAAPRGFGLMQRDRAFDHYQDDGAFYDRRPNLWVEPQGDWGRGQVMLYAYPTRLETLDNIVAFWTPADAPKPGQRLAFNYRLHWVSADLSAGTAARAVDVWQGTAGRPGADPVAGARKIVVDFVGSGLAELGRDSGVAARIDVVRGSVGGSAAYPVVGQRDRWRVTADIALQPPGPADVRLFLQRGATTLSETVLLSVSG